MIQGQILVISSLTYTVMCYKGQPIAYTPVVHSALCRSRGPLLWLGLVVRRQPQTFALQVI